MRHKGESQDLNAVRSAWVWHATFLEPGLHTPLAKTLRFTDDRKIRELARRGEARQTSEDRQMLEHAIAKGQDGVYLTLLRISMPDSGAGNRFLDVEIVFAPGLFRLKRMIL